MCRIHPKVKLGVNCRMETDRHATRAGEAEERSLVPDIAWLELLGLEQLELAGAERGLRAAAGVKLGIDGVEMFFDGAHRNHELLRNGVIGQPGRHQAEHLQLARAQSFAER